MKRLRNAPEVVACGSAVARTDRAAKQRKVSGTAQYIAPHHSLCAMCLSSISDTNSVAPIAFFAKTGDD